MSKITYIVASIALIAVLGAFIGTLNAPVQRNLAMDAHLEDLWSHWKLAYGKSYLTAEEDSHKFATFKENYYFIVGWNADATATSTVGLNQFADMNTEEFSNQIGCLNLKGMSLETIESTEETTTGNDGELPASWDWRAKGAVTPIKNQ